MSIEPFQLIRTKGAELHLLDELGLKMSIEPFQLIRTKGAGLHLLDERGEAWSIPRGAGIAVMTPARIAIV
jgi:hypothetical protein